MSPHLTFDSIRGILDTAQQWVGHVRDQGSRFNVTAKADQAVRFTLGSECDDLSRALFSEVERLGFSIPTCLRGVKGQQLEIRKIARSAFCEGRRLFPQIMGDKVALYAKTYEQLGEQAGTLLIGFLKDKHARWVLPILRENDYLHVYIKNVTGLDRETAGVNIVITDLTLALAHFGHESVFANDSALGQVA